LDLHAEAVTDPADPEPYIRTDREKVAERGRILQDRFCGDDAGGTGVRRGAAHERLLLAVAAAWGKAARP